MKHLRNVLHALGPWGLFGLGVLLLCAAFYWSTLKPAAQNLSAQRIAAQNLKSRTPYQPVSVDRRVDDLRQFHELFPPANEIPNEVEKLWVLASEFKLDMPTGEYRLESSSPGLVRYRITLPIRGSYAQLRQFVDTVLKTIPTMSIDGLRFERKKIADTQLDAQIRLTLYFRPGTATEPQP